MSETGFEFPRPGKVVIGLMVALGAVSLAFPFAQLASAKGVFSYIPFDPRAFASGQLWRALSSFWLAERWQSLLFDLLAIYFLGTALERRWSGARIARAFVVGGVAGNAMVLLAWAALPASFALHPKVDLGPSAALTALTVAWGAEFPDSRIMLMFVIPVRGVWMKWLTIVICALLTLYEGAWAPWGGLLAGLALGGSPSPARKAYLQMKLRWLTARGKRMTVEQMLGTSKRPKPNPHHLRVLPGGLDEKPPKDKTWLN
jgi:membrane associated rhomboid family serine protease